MDEEEEVAAAVEVEKSKGVEIGGGSGGGGKVARLPRWTRQEILVLIQGKRVAENRVRRGRSNNNVVSEEEGGGGVGEPKWATVSSYCKRHGVNRGPVQCRKRWSNLAGDFKKIKEWESQIKDESESFWLMRNDFRRDRKLPGFFDKEVFDILNINNINSNFSGVIKDHNININNNNNNNKGDDKENEVVFDSGRSAAVDDGLFLEFEQSTPQQQQSSEQPLVSPTYNPTPIPAPTPISEKQYKYQPMNAETSGPGRNHEKQQQEELNPEMGSSSREGRKRRRFSQEDNNNNGGEEGSEPLQDQLIQVLEKNGRIINSQLDAYNFNLKMDREERKEHATRLVAVLNKLADSLGRIADKLQ